VGNDFENLQKIYEEGYRGYSMQPPANPKYRAAHAPAGYSYRKGALPGYPGKVDQFQLGSVGDYQVPTVAIIADEEVEAAEIINLDVLKKLDELVDEAENDGMDYAILQLAELKRHIISLSE